MSTNQERRAEARQRLREQMEAQAKREKRLRITAGAVVAVLLLGLVGFVVWKKEEKRRAELHASHWTSCEYTDANDLPEKVDPAQYKDKGPEVAKQVEEHNKQVDQMKETKRNGKHPEGEQPKVGSADVVFTVNGKPVPVTLDRSKAPCNVASMVGLIDQKFYDGTPCHRLTLADKPNALAVLQCGDPTGIGATGPGYTIVDEPPTGLASSEDGMGSVYPRGTLAMAKTQEPNSAGSQFFFVYKDSVLPPDYSVLGTITEDGLKVVDAIAKDGVKNADPKSEDNQKPKNPVKIATAVVESQDGLPDD